MGARKDLTWALLIAMPIALWQAPSAVAQSGPKPSFDCTRATMPDERLICGNPDLAAADAEMAKLFRQRLDQLAPEDGQQLISAQREWLARRKIICSVTATSRVTDATAPRIVACLKRTMAERIADLRQQADNRDNHAPDPVTSNQQVPNPTAKPEILDAATVIRRLDCANLTVTDVMDQTWNEQPETFPFGIPASRWTDAEFEALTTRFNGCATMARVAPRVELDVDGVIRQQERKLREAANARLDAARTKAQVESIQAQWSAGTTPAPTHGAPVSDEAKRARGQVEVMLADGSSDGNRGGRDTSSTSRPTSVSRDLSARTGTDIASHPVIAICLLTYVVVTGFIGLSVVRPPLIGWYRSQWWFIRGTGPVDILFKQIGFRLGFEFFIYGVSCVFGALGGFLWVVLRKRKIATA